MKKKIVIVESFFRKRINVLQGISPEVESLLLNQVDDLVESFIEAENKDHGEMRRAMNAYQSAAGIGKTPPDSEIFEERKDIAFHYCCQFLGAAKKNDLARLEEVGSAVIFIHEDVQCSRRLSLIQKKRIKEMVDSVLREITLKDEKTLKLLADFSMCCKALEKCKEIENVSLELIKGRRDLFIRFLTTDLSVVNWMIVFSRYSKGTAVGRPSDFEIIPPKNGEITAEFLCRFESFFSFSYPRSLY